jgi:addiction module RelE/StbE family toxin
MRIRWEEGALSDLAALRAYIQQDNPDAAQRVAQRIIECVKLLADQPFLGEPGRIHKTRELVVSKTPYTLIYHATADTISILRVFHQSRQWPAKL